MNRSARIAVFVVCIVLGTTLVILLVHWITGSWAVGAAAGIIAGGLSVALYPLLLSRK